MVKVSKIAVWDVDGHLIRNIDEATKATRLAVIQEMMVEHNPEGGPWGGDQEIAEWVSDNWKDIENRVKAAMAGT